MKKTKSETKDTLIEIKNNLHGNNSRVDDAENQINDLEHKEAKKKKPKTKNKKSQSEQQEEKRIQKNKDSASSLWDNFKRPNIAFTSSGC